MKWNLSEWKTLFVKTAFIGVGGLPYVPFIRIGNLIRFWTAGNVSIIVFVFEGS